MTPTPPRAHTQPSRAMLSGAPGQGEAFHNLQSRSRGTLVLLFSMHHTPTVSPLMIPLVYCHIKSFQQASPVEKPLLGGEQRRDGRASHPVAWWGDGGVSPPVCATGLSLSARGCLSGATSRGAAVDVGSDASAWVQRAACRRMAVLSTLRAPALCRHVHRALLRSALPDVILRLSATACHQINYI